MVATPIATATRYTSRGSTKCYWVETISNPAAPTRSELNAGTDLSPELMDQDGWTEEPELLDAPDLASRRTKQVAGPINPSEPSLTMYASKTGADDDIRTVVDEDDEGYIVWLYGGDVGGQTMSVFPVTVVSLTYQPSVSGSDVDTVLVSFAVRDDTQLNLDIPAA